MKAQIFQTQAIREVLVPEGIKTEFGQILQQLNLHDWR
jgi:hypothetical protein